MKVSSYDRALELCRESGVTPLFSQEDWKGYRVNSISVDYPVKCLFCGRQYFAHFRASKMTKCSCSNKNITRLSNGKEKFEKALNSEGLQLLDDFTQASRRGSSVMFSVRCTKCGRKYQTYWKSGQFIHCGCEAYLKALDTCKEFGVIPLFTREDWKGGSDKNLISC